MYRISIFCLLILTACAGQPYKPTLSESLYALDASTTYVVETTAMLLEQERICLKEARRIRDYASVVSAASDSALEQWVRGDPQSAEAQAQAARRLLQDLEIAFAKATENSTDHAGLNCDRPTE
jgi:hypothetical protein